MTIDQDGDPSDASPSDPPAESPSGDAPASAEGAPANAETTGEVVGGFDNPEEATADGPLGSFFSGEQQEVSGSIDQPAAGDGAPSDPEAEAGEEAPSPEADTDAGADDEAETESAETDPEAAGEEDEGRQARREEWLGRVQEETGIQAESTDELTEQVNRLKTQNEGFHELQQIVESNAGFQKMLSEMAGGKTPAEAAAALDGVTTEAPDPNENPEAYAEWKAAQKMKEKEQQREQEQQSDREQKIQREKRRLESEFENVVRNNDLSDDQAQALGETLARLTVSQPGASLRAKDLETLRKGMQHDKIVEQKIEEARKEEREKVLAKVRGDGTIDAETDLPDLRTGGGPSENEQGSQVEDEQLQQAFGPSARDTTDLHGRV
jgi:hypothetical protein